MKIRIYCILYIVPLMRHTIVVCINSIIPMAIGCLTLTLLTWIIG